MAALAWFCVEAETCRLMASQYRDFVIYSAPISLVWRLPQKTMEHLDQPAGVFRCQKILLGMLSNICQWHCIRLRKLSKLNNIIQVLDKSR